MTDTTATTKTDAAIETVKVEMVGSITGTRNGEPWPARGEAIELPSAEAAMLIRQGMAKEADDASAVSEPDEGTTTGESGSEGEPTAREALEAEAAELGVSFPSNIGDEKLTERIAEAKAKAEAEGD